MLNVSYTLRRDYNKKEIVAALNSSIASMMIVLEMNWTLNLHLGVQGGSSSQATAKLLELRILRDL